MTKLTSTLTGCLQVGFTIAATHISADEVGPLPVRHWRDQGRVVADAALAAVPFVGGSVQILFDDILQPSLDKRRDVWLEKLGKVVDELQGRLTGFDPASLDMNDQFVTAVMKGTRIAMGTHRMEKLDFLSACLVNLVISGAPTDIITGRILRFIDELEPEHFLVPLYAVSPGTWYENKGLDRGSYYMGSPSTLVERAGLPVSGPQLDLVLRDLESHGLAHTGSLKTNMTADGMWNPFATDLGRQLISFITLPPKAQS